MHPVGLPRAVPAACSPNLDLNWVVYAVLISTVNKFFIFLFLQVNYSISIPLYRLLASKHYYGRAFGKESFPPKKFITDEFGSALTIDVKTSARH